MEKGDIVLHLPPNGKPIIGLVLNVNKARNETSEDYITISECNKPFETICRPSSQFVTYDGTKHDLYMVHWLKNDIAVTKRVVVARENELKRYNEKEDATC